ncbi:hypothetical protein P3672_28190, partial [Vibrio parahaemolyticus]|nr:hypothetical protein [Vibrio parahaemolyticus]
PGELGQSVTCGLDWVSNVTYRRNLSTKCFIFILIVLYDEALSRIDKLTLPHQTSRYVTLLVQ